MKKIIKGKSNKELEFLLQSNSSIHYHKSWLLDNCNCSHCIQESSGQKINVFNKNKSFNQIEIDGKLFKIDDIDANDEHILKFKLQDLINDRYDIPNRHSEKKFGLTIPKLDYKTANLKTMLEKINDHGIALIQNIPVDNEYFVKEFADKIDKPSHTIYGETFDVKSVKNPINVAYSNEELPPHMDLAYYESPPGLQLLHCLKNRNVDGGESTFVDAHEAGEVLKLKYPKEFNILTKYPVTFKKDHSKRDNPVNMYYYRPHISVNDLNEVTSVFWAPPFEGKLNIDYNMVDKFYEARKIFNDVLESLKIQFKLKENECVIFNNRRLLHGRNSFKDNEHQERHLRGTYVDIDMFLNSYRLLKSQDNVEKRQGISSFY